MKKFWNKIKTYWEVYDLTDVTESISLAITVVSLVVGMVWGMLSLLFGVISFLMLDWIIRLIVLAAVVNTARLLWRDRNRWHDEDETDEPGFL